MTAGDATSLTVGQYRCEHCLGAGASGVVYLGIHVGSGARRAIKALSPDVLSDADAADALQQQIVAAQSLSHPNIVKIHELLEDSHRVFVVMEHVTGADLSRVLAMLEPRPLAPDLAVNIATQLCDALDHAHRRSRSIVHGSLWPRNVMVSTEGRVKLTDFGYWTVAPRADVEGGASIRTHLCYRSPEHVRGEQLTPATDVFGVGVLLYEMLTGRPPFIAETAEQTAEQLERGVPTMPPAVAPALWSALRRALSKDRAARHPQVAQLGRELALAVPTSGSATARGQLGLLVGEAMTPGRRRGPTSEHFDTSVPTAVHDDDESAASIGGADFVFHGEEDPTRVDSLPDGAGAPGEMPLGESTNVEDAGVEDDRPPTAVTEIKSQPNVVDALEPLAGQRSDWARAPGSPPTTHVTAIEAGTETTAITELAQPDDPHFASEPALDDPSRTDVTSAEVGSGDRGTDSLSTVAGLAIRARGAARPILRVPRPATADAADDHEPPDGDTDVEDGSYAGHEPGRTDVETGAGTAPTGNWQQAPSAATTETGGAVPLPPAPTGRMRSASGRARAPLVAAPRQAGPTPMPRGTGPLPQTQDSAAPQTGPVLPRGSAGQPGQSAPPSPAPPLGPPPKTADTGLYFQGYDTASFASMDGSQMLPAMPTRVGRLAQLWARATPAHLLLAVAVIVFLFSVGLLVRRLVQRRAAPPVPAAIAKPTLASPRSGSTEERQPTALPLSEDPHKAKRPELRVHTRPTASVWVDGKLIGPSPLDIPVPPHKQLRVVLIAARHQFHRQVVRAPARGPLKLDVTLEPASYPRFTGRRRGYLNVVCARGDTRRILLDGKDTGYSCPRVGFALRPGRYRVGLYDVRTDETKRIRTFVRARRRKIVQVGGRTR